MLAGKSHSSWALLLVGALLACAQAKPDDPLGETPALTPDAAPSGYDVDNDGYEAEFDCDDHDPNRNPSRSESCDGVDNDCDDNIDEAAFDLRTFYTDADGDGFGDPATATTGCEVPSDAVENGDDCYDGNPDARPGQTGFFQVDRGDGSFDYDCAGGGQSNTPAGNCSYNGTNCGYVEGWDGSAPTCGTSGSVVDTCFLICVGVCFCESDTTSRLNLCR